MLQIVPTDFVSKLKYCHNVFHWILLRLECS